MGLWVNINWQYNATYIQYKDCSKAHYLHDFLRQLLRRKDPSLTSTSGRRQKPANKEANGSSKWCCYKMKISFYNEVTWRGNSTTTKRKFVFIIKLLEGDTPPLQNEDWFLHVIIISFATKSDWVFTCCLPKGNFPCYKMRLGFYMLSSDGQIPLLQNDFRFLKVFQLPKRWKLIKCNSQAVGTKCLAHPHFFILI